MAQMTGEVEVEERPDELDMEPFAWTRKDDVRESVHMMLSHHPPSLFGHCLRLTFRGKSIYFCARCSGIYGGLLLGIPILFLLDALTPGVLLQPTWTWFLIALAMGFATTTDWVTQRLTPRKTTVRIRAVTGFLSGFGLAIIFLLGDLLYMLSALIIMTGSVGGVGVMENRRSKRSKSAETLRDEDSEI